MSTVSSNSILDSTKQLLSLEPDDPSFDIDVIIHINSVFSTLNQLGIGPVNGFMIENATKVWSDFLADDLLLNSVKTLMYLQVRMYFDPPTTSFHLESLSKQIQELMFRINVHREMVVHPLVTVVVSEDD